MFLEDYGLRYRVSRHTFTSFSELAKAYTSQKILYLSITWHGDVHYVEAITYVHDDHFVVNIYEDKFHELPSSCRDAIVRDLGAYESEQEQVRFRFSACS